MAGLWNLSFQQLHDLNGNPYPGAKAYFYAADSLTPIAVYQDYGLGTAHPNPVEADANGVFPPVFLDEADNFFRQRITSRGGVVIGRTDLTVLPIIGPSGGGGGSEVPVDPNALFQTGDVIWLDTAGTRAGWVRDNGRTIGSATSGASERANADCEQLYLFGWAAGWTVSGGSGANAAADWAANKPITLPDKRLKGPFGLADMGNTSAAVPSTLTFTTGDATTAGSICGGNSDTLDVSKIPSHAHANTLTDPGHAHSATYNGSGAASGSATSPIVIIQPIGQPASFVTASSTTGITINNANAGGGGPHNNVQLSVLGTFYRKL